MFSQLHWVSWVPVGLFNFGPSCRCHHGNNTSGNTLYFFLILCRNPWFISETTYIIFAFSILFSGNLIDTNLLHKLRTAFSNYAYAKYLCTLSLLPGCVEINSRRFHGCRLTLNPNECWENAADQIFAVFPCVYHSFCTTRVLWLCFPQIQSLPVSPTAIWDKRNTCDALFVPCDCHVILSWSSCPVHPYALNYIHRQAILYSSE